MTEEKHRITITIEDVIVDLRSNGDGFEYAKVKGTLRDIVYYAMKMTSDTLILGYGKITVDDEVA